MARTLDIETTKCPSCGRDIRTAICPFCGRSAASDGVLEEVEEDSGASWVREFSILWTRVRINGGMEEDFVESGWRMGGASQITRYSRTLWLAINYATIALLVVLVGILSVIRSMDPSLDTVIPLLLTLWLTVLYAVIFLYITYVPPKS